MILASINVGVLREERVQARLCKWSLGGILHCFAQSSPPLKCLRRQSKVQLLPDVATIVDAAAQHGTLKSTQRRKQASPVDVHARVCENAAQQSCGIMYYSRCREQHG